MKQRKESAVDAAALQADLAMRFNLPGTLRRKPHCATAAVGSSSSRGTASSCHGIDASSFPINCESCSVPHAVGSRTCSACGYFFINTMRSPESTLAERRGLMPLPNVIKPLLEYEWCALESQLEGA